ncbi:MAG: polymorphic toxin type 28 domain-containing protein [Janthinobacterium lividum]
MKTFSKETQKLVGRTNKKYKPQLLARKNAPKENTTLKAAEQELKGNQIDLAKQRGRTYDHVEKVENAQEGLLKHIKRIKNRLGYPDLPNAEREVLEKELAKASKLLDHTEGFVPRNVK